LVYATNFYGFGKLGEVQLILRYHDCQSHDIVRIEQVGKPPAILQGLDVSFFTEIISTRVQLARKPEFKELRIKSATGVALAAMMKSCLPCAVS
jgi:hypothetical protein